MSARRWRSGLALALALGAAAAALLAAVSPPTFPLWEAHLVCLELGLVTAAAAAVALLATIGLDGRGAWIARLAAVPALVIASMPALLAVPLYRARHARFAPRAYFSRRSAPPPTRPDLRLEPTRPDLVADVYAPAGTGPHPFVVVAHGGSWRGGDKGDMGGVSWALARAGYVVLDVRYRLAPAHRFPAAVSDVKCVIGHAREQAAELGLDPARGALLGRSAGGQIALVAAYSAGDPRVPPSCAVEDRPVSAVAAFYAPTDLVASYARPLRPDVVDGPASVVQYLGGTPAEVPEAYRLASPVSWLDRPLPPTLLIHGTGDRLVAVERERLLARALAKAGHPVDVLELPLAEHAFDVHVGGVAEQLARQVLIRFLSDPQGTGAARR